VDNCHWYPDWPFDGKKINAEWIERKKCMDQFKEEHPSEMDKGKDRQKRIRGHQQRSFEMIRWRFYPRQGNPVIRVCTALALVILLWGCAAEHSGGEATLFVEIGQPVYYRSETGEEFMARYGGLSDGSLHFVKLKMPDGQEYTLPQVVSGSGVRYTDERGVIWWTHQGSVRVDVRDEEGKWVTRYPELKEIPKSK